MDIVNFLRLVWPEGINFFIVEVPFGKGAPKHFLVNDAKSGAAKAVYQDSLEEGNVYYAMASFKERSYTDPKGVKRKRTQENVDKVKCFWVDLDCKGKKNDYASQLDAAKDLARFCNESGMPAQTLTVDSGYGLHAYWVLDEGIPAAQWESLAARWRVTLDHFGVKHDPSCTSDSARILRPIGTHNYKTGVAARDVRLLGTVKATVSLEAFSSCLMGVPAAVIPAAPSFSVDSMGLNDTLMSAAEHRPSSIKEIVSGCSLLREVGKVGGNVSEPLWHKILGVVKYTVEADKAIHFFSKGHPGYSPEDTIAKAEAWNADGPPSCETLKNYSNGEFPECCSSCCQMGSITNPLALGYPKVLMVEQATVVTAAGIVEKQMDVVAIPPGMQHSFKWENDKLWRSVHDKDASKQGEKVFEWVAFCDHFLYPASYYRDLTDKHQMVWVLREREGVYKEFELTGGAIGAGGQALFKELGECGVCASHGGKTHMEAYITNWGNELKKNKLGVKTYVHFGWHGEDFLYGDTMFRADGTEDKVRVGGVAAEFVKYMTPKGELARWKELIDKAYNRPGMEQFQFILGAGFGSILMPFMGVAGGPTLSAVSFDTGFGKTTACRNAFGIYGYSGESAKITLSMSTTTKNGIFAIAGVLHNFPLVVDEMTTADGMLLSEIIYTYSQGQPKVRLISSGELAKTGIGWSGILLSSSNKPMTNIISASKPSANAELARIIEFDCSGVYRIKKEVADEVFLELKECYGVAGVEYVKYVVTHQTEVKKLLRDTQLALDKKLGLTGPDRYWSAGYTVSVVGLIIAKRLGLIQFDVQAMIAWVVSHIGSMRGSISEATLTPDACFGQLLSDLSPGILVTDNEGSMRGGKEAYIIREPRPPYTGRAVLELGLGYLSQPAANAWCAKRQVDIRAVIAAGVKQGWVLNGGEPEKRYPGKGTNFAMGQVRCFVLDWAALENSVNTAPMLASVVKICSTKGGSK